MTPAPCRTLMQTDPQNREKKENTMISTFIRDP